MASGAPPVKWLILRVLGDVPSATIAELTQALSDQGRAVPRRRPGAGVAGAACREIGLWPDNILIEVICKDASKTGLAVCDRQGRPLSMFAVSGGVWSDYLA